MKDLLLMLLGLVAAGSALGVIAFRNAVHSALSLTVNLVAVAVCFLVLGSQFLAAAQVLIYAGAIMVLFLFAVTILSPKEAPHLLTGGFGQVLGLVLGVLAAGALSWLTSQAVYGTAAPSAVHGTSESFSALLLGAYGLPFEATAFVLLTAIVGAVILGKGAVEDDV